MEASAVNINLKKIFPLLIIFALCQPQAYASPWAKKEGYLNQTAGKFTHGLKHSLFSWMMMWTESREPGYDKQWQGFSAGIGKTVVYTAGGLVQLVTFPVPADFPDFGIGMHIPSKQCPMRHAKDYVPPSKDPLSKKSEAQAAEAAKAGAPKPALKPLTTPSTAAKEPALDPVVTEVKKEAAPVPAAETVKEETEAAKAQEAELAAALAAAAPAPEEPAKDEPLEYDIESETVANPVPAKEEETEPKEKPFEQSFVVPEPKADDKAPLSNEDIVSVAPKAAQDFADDLAIEKELKELDEKDSLDELDEDEANEDLDTLETGDEEEEDADEFSF